MRWAWCGEPVIDDYGHEAPCRQIAEVKDVKVQNAVPGPITICTVECPIREHRAEGVRLEDVCEMPD